ncbi:MAG: hypothetical protein JXQ96_08950 [Cyclobacteriaceae bacterium]
MFYFSDGVLKKILFTFSFFLGCMICQGQSRQLYTSSSDKVEKVINHYVNSDVSHSLSGRKYILRYVGAVNSQFFRGLHPDDGYLIYDGIKYPNIEIQYDIFAQKVVVLLETRDNSQYVTVDNHKVEEFSFNGFVFTNVKGDEVMDEGLYQFAFDGDSDLFIKRTKTRKESFESNKQIISFTSKNAFFVRNDFGTFKVNGKKSLLAAYQDSDELLAVIKKNRIKFAKKNLEQGLYNAIQLFEESTANEE